MSLGMVIFIQWFKPLNSEFANNMETFNECTMICMNYLLMCFTNFVPEAETRSEIGFVYIGLSMNNILFHFIFMIVSSLIATRLKLRSKGQCCYKRTKNNSKKVRTGKPVQSSLVNTNLTNIPVQPSAQQSSQSEDSSLQSESASSESAQSERI